MISTMSWNTPRGLTTLGLAGGAIGIAVLWAAGVEFPFYPPPGLLILAAGAGLVSMVKRPWAAGVGAFLGLFVLVGFVVSSLVSGAGIGNLTGAAGIGGSIGSAIQLIGVTTAMVAGVFAVRQERICR